MAILILLVGILFNLSVILLVISKVKNHSVRWLVSVSLAFVGWQIANYLADRVGDGGLLWNQMSFAAPLLILLFSYYFASSLINIKRFWRGSILLVCGTLLMVILSFSSLIVEATEARLSTEGTIAGYNPVYGPLYFVYIAWIVFLVVLYGTVLRKGAMSRNIKQQRQIKIILYGSIYAVLLALSTNVVIPQLSGSSFSTQLTPVVGIIYMTSFVFAILKHGLFDIRPTIARLVAYSLSVGSLSALYGFVVFGITNFVLDISISFGVHVILAITMGVAAISFQWIIRYFNKLSNAIFYQDSYDPQVLLDQLNQVILSNADSNKAFEKSKQVIKRTLKVGYCEIFLAPDKDKPSYLSRSSRIDIGLLKQLDDVTISNEKNLVVFGQGGPTAKGYSKLKENEASLVVRLCPDLSDRLRCVGYLVLGGKSSGYAFNKGDLDVISNVANELALAIQNYQRFERIRSFNEDLQAKIESATSRLKKTNNKLRQIDESKDEFISMASHQLRTPLTSMKGYVSMVLEGDVGEINEGQKKMLAQAFVSSQRMASLISDLLNVSRLRTGKFVIEKSRVDLADVVQSEVDQLRDTAKARGLELRYEKPDDFPFLMLDETKTRQVVMNFIDNAIYYTPMGGTIIVDLKNKEKTIELTVTDNGIGVPKAEQPHLFTKFYRAGNARKARPDGTGLGLFMAKKVIVAQGGAVIFKTVEGHGSVFGFTFSKENLRAE